MVRRDAGNEVVIAAINKMGELDPMAIIIMASAGTAGLAGVPGPLTKILTALTSSNTGVAGNLNTVEGLEGLWAIGVSPANAGIALYTLLFGGVPQTTTGTTTPPSDKQMQAVGVAASNIVEAGLLYTLVKNDEVLKAGIDAAKTAIGNVTRIPPVIPV